MNGAKRFQLLAGTAALGMFSAFGPLLFGIVGLAILVVATLGTLGNSMRQAVGPAQAEAFAQPLLWLPYAQANAQDRQR